MREIRNVYKTDLGITDINAMLKTIKMTRTCGRNSWKPKARNCAISIST